MQTRFSDLKYAGKKRQTRRERFVAQFDAVTPWAQLEAALAPAYPASQGPGRPPLRLARMLRMYIAQQCLGLSYRASRMPCMTASPSAASSASICRARRRRMRPRR